MRQQASHALTQQSLCRKVCVPMDISRGEDSFIEILLIACNCFWLLKEEGGSVHKESSGDDNFSLLPKHDGAKPLAL